MRIRHTLAALALAWYVCAYNGQAVAGPFGSAFDCGKVAHQMKADGYAVWDTCRWR